MNILIIEGWAEKGQLSIINEEYAKIGQFSIEMLIIEG